VQTSDLLARSSANKALNDKKRLATSSANVARSRCDAQMQGGSSACMLGCGVDAYEAWRGSGSRQVSTHGWGGIWGSPVSRWSVLALTVREGVRFIDGI
jgi:hypothetical protein